MTTAISPPAAQARLLDVRAVATTLNCSTRHVFRLADAGHMPPPVRLGTLVRWRADDVSKWLADGCPRVRHARPVS